MSETTVADLANLADRARQLQGDILQASVGLDDPVSGKHVKAFSLLDEANGYVTNAIRHLEDARVELSRG